MRAELDAVLGHLAARRETEDLIAAAVGQDRMRPADEGVQTAGARDERVAGSKMQVIRIAENDLRARVLDVTERDSLDRAARPHRHEARRLDDAVRRREGSAARAAVGVRDLKTERHFSVLAGPTP